MRQGYYICPVPDPRLGTMLVMEDVTAPEKPTPVELFANGIGGLAADLQRYRIYRLTIQQSGIRLGWHLMLNGDEGNTVLMRYNEFSEPIEQATPLGATGEYPEGQLDADDDGEMNVQISGDASTGMVTIAFGPNFPVLMCPPDFAENLANTIYRVARTLRATLDSQKHDPRRN